MKRSHGVGCALPIEAPPQVFFRFYTAMETPVKSFNPNKHLKEQFVSNLIGSSMLEVIALATVVPDYFWYLLFGTFTEDETRSWFKTEKHVEKKELEGLQMKNEEKKIKRKENSKREWPGQAMEGLPGSEIDGQSQAVKVSTIGQLLLKGLAKSTVMGLSAFLRTLLHLEKKGELSFCQTGCPEGADAV
ncbi:unnamed protein product [Camellia sinensis]